VHPLVFTPAVAHAELVRAQADAEDRGEDAERRKNWEWTIEENEAWEKKLKRKARRADFEFHGAFPPPVRRYRRRADGRARRPRGRGAAAVQEGLGPDQAGHGRVQRAEGAGHGPGPGRTYAQEL
jgi:hypothetical protein